MNCVPCSFFDSDGAYYSYGEETTIIENLPEPGLERILTPIFSFKLFAGFA